MRTFSLKGMTSKLFGQEAPEQREARLRLLEELIAEGEETVREKTAEWRWVTWTRSQDRLHCNVVEYIYSVLSKICI